MNRLLKSFLGILCVLLFLDSGAQPLRNAEYFIDNDPGAGKGIPIFVGSLADSISVSGIQFSTTGLALGLHTLHVRVQDQSSKWSAYKSVIFSVKSLVDTLTKKTSPLIVGEYFVDQDPGIGKGTSISFASSDSASVSNIQVNTSGLSLGGHILGVRVKDGLGRWSAYHTSIFTILAQAKSGDTLVNKPGKIVYSEYFVDTDPGPGHGISIPVTKGDSISVSNIAASTDNLSLGQHSLHIRAMDEFHRWSAYRTSLFNVNSSSRSSDSLINASGRIFYAEYFVDTDPGLGKGTSIPFMIGDSISVSNISFSTNQLSLGQHTLHVRVRDEFNRWSAYHSSFFAINAPKTLGDSLMNVSGNVVAAEYFVDTDPGVGKGTAIPLVAGDSISVANVTFSTKNLSLGQHTFHVRVKDVFGHWSAYRSEFFAVQMPRTRADSSMDISGKIVSAEYFLDSDPGAGKGVSIPVTPGDSIWATNISVATDKLSLGQHTLHVRVKDELSHWSAYRSSFFVVYPPRTRADSLMNQSGRIVAAEYFVDVDPGKGKGILVSVAPSDSIQLQNLKVNTDTLKSGQHTLNARILDEFGHWSAYHSSFFNVLSISVGDTVNRQPFVYGEYFVGNIDPGYGNANLLSNLPPADTIWDFSPEIPTDGLGIGTYPITFRLQRKDGTWTFNNTFTFDVCNAFPPAPTASGGLICGGSGTMKLVAHGVDSVKKYAWFTNSWGGTPQNLNGDSTYTTPLLTQTTRYWAAQVGAQCTGPRTEVAVLISPKLVSPTIPGIINHCGKGRILLTASGALDGTTYRWYNALRDKTWLAVGDSFLTDTVYFTRKYYVSTISTDGACESVTRDSITVNIRTCQTQTITFPKPVNVIYGQDSVVILKASASSGLPIKYTIKGPGSLAGDTITLTGIGQITVTASQPGNVNFYPASDVVQLFQVTSKTDTLHHTDTLYHLKVQYNPVLCTGDQLDFIVVYANGAKYAWTLPNHKVDSTQDLSVYNVSLADSGYYALKASIGKDVQTAVLPVRVHQSPEKLGLYYHLEDKCTSSYKLFTVGNTIDRYQWSFNGKDISNATDSIFIPLFSGLYAVTGFNKYGCKITSNFQAINVDPDTIPVVKITKNRGSLVSSYARTYQWFVNNYYIANSNVQEIPLYFKGDYKVKVTDGRGCEKFSDVFPATDDNLINLREDMFDANGNVRLDGYSANVIQVIPSPASHLVSFNWMSPARGNVVVTISNELGGETNVFYVSKDFELLSYQINVSDWKSGVYIVSIASDLKTVKGKMMVVK
jgi:hypothetical protein